MEDFSKSVNDISHLCRSMRVQFLEPMGVTDKKFARMCQMSRARMKKILDGKTKPTSDEIQNITSGMNLIDMTYDILKLQQSGFDFTKLGDINVTESESFEGPTANEQHQSGTDPLLTE